MNHLRDLRAFVAELQQIGEIQEVDTEVDWNLELGAIARRSYELRAPAPLFTNIRGDRDGFRVLAAPGGLSAQAGLTYARIAVALGLPANSSGADIVTALADARERDPIPPRILTDGPCKQNQMRAGDVDLFRFPTPLIHDGDGGRYLQTYGLNIAKTPDGTWTNWSVNRMMLIDRARLGCLIPPLQHLGIIKSQWQELGEPMPIAVALGVEPALPYVGGMPLPEGVDESHYLGAYFGEPLDLLPAETVDLLVPATAEIIIEGHVSHTETVDEGPMGEYPGYLDRSTALPQPVLNVSAVTFRDHAILPVAVAGAPVEEDHTGWGMPHAAEMTHVLRQARLPIRACWGVLESANHWWVVSVDRDWHEITGATSAQLVQRIGQTVFEAGKLAFGIPKLLVVEDDIDIGDPHQVIWAFASRVHPQHGELHFPNQPQNILPVYLDTDEQLSYHATKIAYNCLIADRFPPDQRPTPSDFQHAWPTHIQQKVIENWRTYGYR